MAKFTLHWFHSAPWCTTAWRPPCPTAPQQCDETEPCRPGSDPRPKCDASTHTTEHAPPTTTTLPEAAHYPLPPLRTPFQTACTNPSPGGLDADISHTPAAPVGAIKCVRPPTLPPLFLHSATSHYLQPSRTTTIPNGVHESKPRRLGSG